MLAATFGLLASTVSPASAQTTSTACGNAPAGYNVIESNARYIIGTTGSDFICAGDGVNTIRAKGKNDIIYGGGGNDIIFGGFGNDKIWGGDGDDIITAGGGADLVNTQAGDDTVWGGQGHDTINGNSGDDDLTGGDGNDIINGNIGDDTIRGNKGWDTLNGGNGEDTIFGGKGKDTITGGAGDDIVNGGAHDDTMNGGAGEDQMRGSSGDDQIDGGPGKDTLNGGDGDDSVNNTDGDDIVNGNDDKAPVDDTDTGDDMDPGDDTDTGDEEPQYPGRLTLVVPTPFSSYEDEPELYELTGTGWLSSEVTVEWSAGSEGGPDPLVEAVAPEGDVSFEVSQNFVDLTTYEPTVTDEEAGVSKTVERAISGYEVDADASLISVWGTPGETVTVSLVTRLGELIEEREAVLAEDGADISFGDASELAWSLDLSHEDSDGDIERHQSVWVRSSIRIRIDTSQVVLNSGHPDIATSNLTWTSNSETVAAIPEPDYATALDGVLAVGDTIGANFAGANKSLQIPEFEIGYFPWSYPWSSVVSGTGTPGDTVYVDIYIEVDGFDEDSDVTYFELGATETVVIDEQGHWTIQVPSVQNEYFRDIGIIDDDGDVYYDSFDEDSDVTYFGQDTASCPWCGGLD